MLRKIVLNLHTYGGLLCFSYLILFGISVLNFNHPFEFTKPPASVTTWTQPIEISALAKADENTPIEVMQRLNNAAILPHDAILRRVIPVFQWQLDKPR